MFGKRYWKIVGYYGTDKTFEKVIPEDSLSKSEIVVILQRLLARYLDEDDVVLSSLRPTTPNYASHLEFQIGRDSHHTIRVGSNPHYVASIRHREELSS